jgi:pimeloyl-ACP methyl ester carboxylesterase
MSFGRHLRSFAVAVVLSLSVAGAARGEIVRLADMLRGIEMTPAECTARPYTVWVTAYRRSVCIRYYLSEAGGTGPEPVVFLSGDKLGVFNGIAFAPRAHDKDVDTDALIKRADGFSRAAGTTAIYLARIGVDGSSGFHGVRRTMLELHIVNEALEAIKTRHRLERFHLFGQSGGAALVASLPALRTDIACAVAGAGPLSGERMMRPADPARRLLDPAEFVAALAFNRAARMLVITDPLDQTVSAERQNSFVRKLRQAGGAVDQFFVQAGDPQQHDVSAYSLLAVSECVRRAPTPEIARKLAAYFQTLLARDARARAGQ